MREGDTDSGGVHRSEGHSLLILLHREATLRLKRRKKGASIICGGRSISSGESRRCNGDYGHTGVAMVVALWVLGSIEGILRPALAEIRKRYHYSRIGGRPF